MSSRHLRRLRQVNEKETSDDDDDTRNKSVAPPHRVAGLFHLLEGDGSESDESDGSDSSDEKDTDKAEVKSAASPTTTKPSSSFRKQPRAQHAAASSSPSAKSLPFTLPISRLDELLLLVHPSSSSNHHTHSTSSSRRNSSSCFLNANAELRRNHGGGGAGGGGAAGAIMNQGAGDIPPPRQQQQQQQQRPNQLLVPHAGIFTEVEHTDIVFALQGNHGHETSWRRVPTKTLGGFSMRRQQETSTLSSSSATTVPTVRTFTLEISEEYEILRATHAAAVESGDPEFLLQIPSYSIETSLQLAEYYRTIGQHASASYFLRRALYALEAVLHPSFAPWEVPCRIPVHLSSSSAESPALALLYRPIFQAMKAACRRGAPLTAFDLGRLLLGFQPIGIHADPLLVLLCLDYYALRAAGMGGGGSGGGKVDSNQWVVDMTSSSSSSFISSSRFVITLGGSTLPLITLPNWSFSRALALFRIECDLLSSQKRKASIDDENNNVKAHEASSSSSSSSSSIPTALYQDTSYMRFDSTHMLVRALLMFPGVLPSLLQTLGGVNGTTVTAAMGSGGAGAEVAGEVAGRREGGEGAGGSGSTKLHPAVKAYTNYNWTQSILSHPIFSSSSSPPLAAGGRGRRTTLQQMYPCSMACKDDNNEYSDRSSSSSQQNKQDSVVLIERFIRIYVQRSSSLWATTPHALKWLYTAAMLACAAYDAAEAASAGEGGGGGGGREEEEEEEATRYVSTIFPDPNEFFKPQDDKNKSTATSVNTDDATNSNIYAIAEVHTAMMTVEQMYTTTTTTSTPPHSLEANALSRYGTAVLSDFVDPVVTIDENVLRGVGVGGIGDEEDGNQNNGQVVDGEEAQQPRRTLWERMSPTKFVMDIADTHPFILLFVSMLPWSRLPGYHHDETREWRGL